MSSSIPALDHLILLAPYPASSSLPKATSHFQSLGFTVLQGGTHKDGLTANILIVLNDGVYLEIISFEEQGSKEGKEAIAKHWWGDKASGWIDFCLLGYPSRENQAAALYHEAVNGGRRTKDGKELAWQVSFPKLKDGERRGCIPFFCQDVGGTQREWRAPPPSPNHSNEAGGVCSLNFLSSKGKSKHHSEVLSSILHQPSSSQISLCTPLGTGGIKIKILEESTQEHSDWIRDHGEGIWEVEIGVGQAWAEKEKGKKLGESWIEPSTEEAGYGRWRLTVV